MPYDGVDSTFVIGTGLDVRIYTWERTSTDAMLRALIPVVKPGDFIIDGKCDINGRLWVGEYKPSYAKYPGYTCIGYSVVINCIVLMMRFCNNNFIVKKELSGYWVEAIAILLVCFF